MYKRQEEWGSSKDPSVKTKDETLRNYAKRGLSKKLAQTIVYRLTPEILLHRINERNETQRSLMADDLLVDDACLLYTSVFFNASTYGFRMIRCA